MKIELRFRRVLQVNAFFSAGCALIMLMAPRQVGEIIGWSEPLFYWVLAAGLLVFAGDLLHQSTRPKISLWRGYLASISDLLWVLVTLLVLMWLGVHIPASGWGVLLGVAAVVLSCGLMQLYELKRLSAPISSSDSVSSDSNTEVV